MIRLQAALDEKMDQWAREAENNAARAKKAGRTATLVIYPTGLKMMRFAEPFTDYGMHYEIEPEIWEGL